MLTSPASTAGREPDAWKIRLPRPARFQLLFPSESTTYPESLVPGVCYSEASRSLREHGTLEVQVSPLCNRIFQPTPRPSAAGSEKARPLASSPLNPDPPLARWRGLCLAKRSQFGPFGRRPVLPNEPNSVCADNCLFPLNQRLPASRPLSDNFTERTQFRPFRHSPPAAPRLTERSQFQAPPGPRSRCGCVLPNEPNPISGHLDAAGPAPADAVLAASA